MLRSIFAIAILLVGCGFGPSSARADVAIAGGTDAQRMAIAAVYDSLPACCKSDFRVAVVLMTASALDRYVRNGLDPVSARMLNVSSIDGVYENPAPTITLRSDGDCATLCQTFAHEYAHCLWQRRLTRDQQRDYTRLYASQKAARHLVTPYAATSVEEGFAEAYSFFVTAPATLAHRDSASSAFLKAAFEQSAGKAPASTCAPVGS